MASAPTRIPSLPGTADDIPASENSCTLTPDAASRVASPIPSRLGRDSAQQTREVRAARHGQERRFNGTAARAGDQSNGAASRRRFRAKQQHLAMRAARWPTAHGEPAPETAGWRSRGPACGQLPRASGARPCWVAPRCTGERARQLAAVGGRGYGIQQQVSGPQHDVRRPRGVIGRIASTSARCRAFISLALRRPGPEKSSHFELPTLKYAYRGPHHLRPS